ncbi:MAG: nitrite reductase small subunit NirD [Fluviibacter sp.]
MTTWKTICPLSDIPPLGSRIVRQNNGGDIAIFRTSEDEVFALHDKCPHKGGPLSQGIVHGQKVTCPLHAWNIELKSGQAIAPDSGQCGTFQVRVENGQVLLAL